MIFLNSHYILLLNQGETCISSYDFIFAFLNLKIKEGIIKLIVRQKFESTSVQSTLAYLHT